MKKVWIMSGISILILLLLLIGWKGFLSPISKEDGVKGIRKSLDRFQNKHEEVDHIVLRLYSESKGFDEYFYIGEDQNLEATEPLYHVASIGKTLTATLFYVLAEEQSLSLDDPITMYLDEEVTKNLFNYEGVDYSKQVTIRYLINHTSGIACYFDGSVKEGPQMQERMLSNTSKYWSPVELIAFTQDYQVPLGKPGQVFNYSDTGYMLLMLILEATKNKPYYQVFREKLFEPLGMKDSFTVSETNVYQSKRGEMLPLIIKGQDISQSDVLSVGNSDGGIISSATDLMVFFTALHSGELISMDSLKQMKEFNYDYQKGVKYGSGMMFFNLGELTPLMPDEANIYGGVGVTSSFMLYDEEKDLYIILNVGISEMMEESITEIMKILMIYNRIQ